MTVLELDNVDAGYGDHRVLRDVTLSVDAGCTVLLGPNGAGKTTLFRVGAGVLEPTTGTVSISGTDPFETPETKREVGYLPHTPSLRPELSVRENLEFWGRLFDLDDARIERRIDSLSSTLDFEDLLAKDAGNLSRGQVQRATIARALLHDPSLLFLDEPTTGLDPSVKAKLTQLLQDIASSDRALVYATHNLHEANKLADDIVVIRNGSIVTAGSRDEVIDQYQGVQTVEIETAGGDAETELRAMGYDPARHGNALQFEVDAGTTVMNVLQDLDDRGVEVERIDTEQNAFERLYQTLNEGESDG